MTCTVRNFDRYVLTPIFWLFNAAAVACVIGFHWWWLAGAVLGCFYTGVIGAKIHPRQSFTELTQDSLAEPTATKEETNLSALEHRFLVSQACTHVGILAGVTTGIVMWSILDWRWYLAVIIGFGCLVFTGVILKLLFRSV